jgi:hypothetical protein
MSAWTPLSWSELKADPSRSRFAVLLGYILPLLLFDALYPRRTLPIEAPGICRLTVEIVLLLVIYDVSASPFIGSVVSGVKVR